MKDITIRISRQRQRHELITFAVCFAAAFLTNVYAIVAYNAPWTELFTSIFFVITFAIALYMFWGCVRLVACKLRRKNKTTDKTINL